MVSEASKTSPERAKWDLPAPMKALGSPSASYAKPKPSRNHARAPMHACADDVDNKVAITSAS